DLLVAGAAERQAGGLLVLGALELVHLGDGLDGAEGPGGLVQLGVAARRVDLAVERDAARGDDGAHGSPWWVLGVVRVLTGRTEAWQQTHRRADPEADRPEPVIR